MNRLSLPLLLLVPLVSLVSLVSGTDLQNHERLVQVDTVKLENLLKDLSDKLAENRLMIQQLHKENAEQSAKLTEFKNQVDSQQQEQSAKLTEFKNQVDSQQQEMKSRLEKSEYEVEILRKDREDGRVVFSTSLSTLGGGFIGPYDSSITLIFKHVFTNYGNAYNNLTGIFTAPHRGLYSFDFTIYGERTRPMLAQLLKNTKGIVVAYESQTAGWGSTGNRVILQLEPGDEVFLRLRAKSIIFDDQNNHSTFSGRLLFPL